MYVWALAGISSQSRQWWSTKAFLNLQIWRIGLRMWYKWSQILLRCHGCHGIQNLFLPFLALKLFLFLQDLSNCSNLPGEVCEIKCRSPYQGISTFGCWACDNSHDFPSGKTPLKLPKGIGQQETPEIWRFGRLCSFLLEGWFSGSML